MKTKTKLQIGLFVIAAAAVLYILHLITGGGGAPVTNPTNPTVDTTNSPSGGVGGTAGSSGAPSGAKLQQQRTAAARDAVASAREALRTKNLDAAKRAVDNLKNAKEGIDPALKKEIEQMLADLDALLK